MGRTSTKENKNSYQLAREELGLTREKASELLETIAPERIEKIENERTVPRPDEVLTMAEKYKRPALCNYYCSRQCPIGREYVPQVSVRELSAIVLEMLASLNAMDKKKERLIEITADGQISSDEMMTSSASVRNLSASRSPSKHCSSGPSGCSPTARSMPRPTRPSCRSRKMSPRSRYFLCQERIKPSIFLFSSCFCNKPHARIVLHSKGNTA